ncbi:MAG: hypothetical protein KME01_13605 [Chroococcus sp. CMT-3BRIN-NPC107]|jgi:deoxycytidine triphosphate deaminase|nr:hypothetical protein [Chroococcus sp. CMT-3BRIN-NPC107]
MSVLSEWDIVNELGRGILFYPFKGKANSIRGCCLCLTASKYGYTFQIDENNNQKIVTPLIRTEANSNKEYLLIPKRKTAVIWTNESILLKSYFCGSVHSKVKLVSKGIGNLGTRVNPNYGGVLAVALHNLSETDIRIDVGEVIAYVRVYKLNSASSCSRQIDEAGKISDAIPEGFVCPPELNRWLNDLSNLWVKGDSSTLEKILKQSAEYNHVKDELKQKSIRYRFIFKYLPQWEPNVWFNAVIAVGTTILAIIGLFSLIQATSQTSSKQKQIVTPNSQLTPPSKVTTKKDN